MVRIFSARDGLVPEDLFQSACDHLGAAETLAEKSASFLDSAGYLAHIALELNLKAWLLFAAGQFSGVHSLSELYDELRRTHGAPALPTPLSDLMAIFESYGDLRYPNRNAPTEVDSKDVGHLNNLFMFLFEHFPAELHEAIHKLELTKKGGRVLMTKKTD